MIKFVVCKPFQYGREGIKFVVSERVKECIKVHVVGLSNTQVGFFKKEDRRGQHHYFQIICRL